MSSESLCIVRLSRTAWHNENGVHYKTSLTYLKRKCVGYNILDDSAHMAGAIESEPINMHELADGIYSVVMANISRDYESGMIDGYDLALAPYEEVSP